MASSSRTVIGSRLTATWSTSNSRQPTSRLHQEGPARFSPIAPLQRQGPMLSVNNIEVVYDNVVLVLRGVSLEVRAGAITTLLGANGAGKTTTLKAISGVLGTERGAVTKGSITFGDKRIDGMRPFDVTRIGISQVFEGRRVFEHLTTEENLIAGGHVQREPRKLRRGIELVYSYFPLLKERRHQLSGYLSGGEQQMLAIGRALMSEPKVVLLDEPSLGLAPMLVVEIFDIVQRLVTQESLSVLLVEQNAAMAVSVAQHGYVMETGRIVLEGSVQKLRDNSDIREFYLGLNEVGSRKSYRDVKHYKRRKPSPSSALAVSSRTERDRDGAHCPDHVLTIGRATEAFTTGHTLRGRAGNGARMPAGALSARRSFAARVSAGCRTCRDR